MFSLKRVASALAVLLLLVVALVGWRAYERGQEWEHGGDDVEVSATVHPTTVEGFEQAVVDLGLEPQSGVSRAEQMFLAEVSWTGSPDPEGTFFFVLLDGRLGPPKPIDAYESWNGDRHAGATWHSALDVLPDHYPWLARVAPVETSPGVTETASALSVTSAEEGRAVLSFSLDRGELPVTAPDGQLILAVAFFDPDGDVRWAKQVPLAG